jgi:hypothetical protein
VFVLVLALLLCARIAAMDKWLPVSPADLAMKDAPGNPGVHAIILFKEVSGDDNEDMESNYVRIKIFTEEGRKYGDVEIPYRKDVGEVVGLEARTIRPDGSTVKFEGQVFDKLLVKQRRFKWWAKTFTLPEVQPGCMIEYRYTIKRDDRVLHPTQWDLQDELFIRKAKFSLRPYRGRVASIHSTQLKYLVKGLSPDKGVQNTGQMLALELEDLPAFEKEQHMPPENLLKRWVFFYYGRADNEAPDQFWAREAKDWQKDAESFIAGADGAAQEVGAVAPASDPPDTRLRKLYARVQRLRNLSFEESGTTAAKEREKLKDNQKIADVLKNGYGYQNQLNRLFAGLARAAGFQASMVRVSTRDENFFAPALMDTGQLPSEVVEVSSEGKTLYLDPGTAFCPYGLLSWEKTGVQALRLNAAGGVFIKMPSPASGESRTERKASLRLGEDGSVEGTLRVSFYGQEALEHRQAAVEEDEVGRRKALEEVVKKWLPASASVELVSAGAWEASETPLEADFKVKVPDLAAITGQRVLLPLGVFQTTAEHPFQAQRRVHAVYFLYPYEELDEIELQFPSGYRAETLPAPRQSSDANFGTYSRSLSAVGNSMHIRRTMSLVGIHYPVEYYPLLRLFFDKLHNGDEDRAVLQAAGASAGK